jgi:uncharacterized protein (DUF1800 family)
MKVVSMTTEDTVRATRLDGMRTRGTSRDLTPDAPLSISDTPDTSHAVQAASSREPAGGDTAPAHRASLLASLAAPMALAACGGGGGGDGTATSAGGLASPADVGAAPSQDGTGTVPVPKSAGLTVAQGVLVSRPAEPSRTPMSRRDAARLLTQASFGIRTPDEVDALAAEGAEHWLWRQFSMPYALHTSYLDVQRQRDYYKRAFDTMSFEAIWRQWLFEEGQLRARVAFALSQIMVISNVAGALPAYALSSYMDLLNRQAFGTYRDLLGAVTLHPAMGYYLNMLRSRKADEATGTHPNENYAREVLQLFSIGLVQLNADGSTRTGANGQPLSTYDEAVVKGFARAFTGWSFGGQGNGDAGLFDSARFDLDANWTTPMRPFAAMHEPGPKQLLDGVVLPGGQSIDKDLNDALDQIAAHPNVGPFIGRQLIQRLVTSNPSAAYIARITAVFNDNGAGVRGDLRAVVQAILLDPEARGDDAATRPRFGKQREPVIRFANMLRALGATTASTSGRTDLQRMDQGGDTLGQSPLMAPSVFNFFSPNYRQSGVLAQAGLVAPEFQATTEATVVGLFNAFTHLINWSGYGWDEGTGDGGGRVNLDMKTWEALALSSPAACVDRLDVLLFNAQMSDATRATLLDLIAPGPRNDWGVNVRIRKALIFASVAPDFVIQK